VLALVKYDGSLQPEMALPRDEVGKSGRFEKASLISLLAEFLALAIHWDPQRRIRKLDATATQIANKGASGDLRAGKMLLDMAAQAEARDAAQTAPETLTISDQEILDDFLAEYRKHLEEGGIDEAGDL